MDPEAAQAALRIGGIPALVQMIVVVVGGEPVDEALDRQGRYEHMSECDMHHTGVCDMGCDRRVAWGPVEDPEL